MTGPELAARAKIDRKSVNNMLNARHNSDMDNVDAVAEVFGLRGWQLITDDIGTTPADARQIESLIARFNKATPEQREIILRVAEMTGSYDPSLAPQPPPKPTSQRPRTNT